MVCVDITKGINLITCERSFFKIVSKGSAEGHSLKKWLIIPDILSECSVKIVLWMHYFSSIMLLNDGIFYTKKTIGFIVKNDFIYMKDFKISQFFLF